MAGTKSKRNAEQFHRLPSLALFGLITAFATLIAATHHHSHPIGSVRASNSIAAAEGSASGDAKNVIPDSLVPGRPLYPFSVIPGGVESARELKMAIRNDPVVSAHYADFDVANAHIVSLNRDRAFYVSYRMGDEVFWTKHPLLLHKGETLISDGIHDARTRCGNRLSETPEAPVSSKEVAPAAFERLPNAGPFDVANLPFDNSLAPPPPFSPLALADTRHENGAPWVGPFGLWPGSVFGPGTTPSSAPGSPFVLGSPLDPVSPSSPGIPVSTPEPSTLLLFSGGIAGLWITRRFRKAQ